jgi:hypothetical protein
VLHGQKEAKTVEVLKTLFISRKSLKHMATPPQKQPNFKEVHHLSKRILSGHCLHHVAERLT